MNRRDFVLAAALFPVAAASAKEKNKEEEIGPVEDLMREHGLLRRILLVYDEVARRLHANEKYDPEALRHAADLVRKFVEDYHERDEEQYLFPRFEKAQKLVELVSTLRAQHQEGRRLTDQILHGTNTLRSLEQFNRMYRAHAAREDTVLFPALHKLVSEKELDQLGDKFEEIEKSHISFEKALAEVGEIERSLGIADLSKYTPT